MMISYYLTSHKTWWVVNMVGEVSIRVVELGGHHTQVDPVECSTRTGLTLHGLQGVISRQRPCGNSESRFPKIWWSTCVDHRARFNANTGAIFKIKKGKKAISTFFFFEKFHTWSTVTDTGILGHAVHRVVISSAPHDFHWFMADFESTWHLLRTRQSVRCICT